MSLGRGLGALITSTGQAKQSAPKVTDAAETVLHVAIADIFSDPKQPRRDFPPEALDELALSIKAHGVLQPILVAEEPGGKYRLIAGERRWRASKLAGLTVLPALVKRLPEQEKLEVALIENIQRQDLNPIEEACAYERLIAEFHLTQQQVADKVGKSRPAVANTLRLLDLPPAAQAALREGKIKMGQGRALLALPSAAEQLNTLSSMLGQKITVRELEKKAQEQRRPTAAKSDPNIAFLESELRSALGAQTSIRPQGRGGVIDIRYYSEEELAEIIKRITE